MNTRFFIRVAAYIATASIIFSNRPAQAAPIQWTQFHSTKPGFTIEHPAGWTVRAQGTQIVVQSADRASIMQVEAFVPHSGETAKTRLGSFATSHLALFPKAHIERVTQQASAGDAAIGALSYTNTQGKPAQARVLCSIFKRSGLIYILAAPSDRFTAERRTLVRILKSLRFGTASTVEAKPVATGKRGAPNANALRFVKWTDPKEGAFSVDAPAGWSIDGGTIRIATTQVNKVVQAASPDKQMLLRIGDPSLPMLEEPDARQMQLYGVREGQPVNPNGNFIVMFLHYMPAAQFNPWYLNTVFTKSIENLTITKTQELPQIARHQTDAGNKMAAGSGQVQVTVAVTEFKGIDKQTHKPIVGVLASTVQRTQLNNGGRYWGPTNLIVSGCTDDSQVTMRQTKLRAAIERISRSWRDDPQWLFNENQRVQAGTARVNKATTAAIAAISKSSQQEAANADAARESIMGAYWNRVGAQDEVQRQQANYYGDRTDVGNASTGTSASVASGYSNYYLDPRTNTIIGTNSPTRPRVDFTPLTQY